MAKKAIKNAAKGLNLQAELLISTGQALPTKREDSEAISPQTSPPDYGWERFAFVCDKTLVAKVKAISSKEGFKNPSTRRSMLLSRYLLRQESVKLLPSLEEFDEIAEWVSKARLFL